MVPIKIQPHFNITYQKNNGKNTLVTGHLTCCNAHDFEIYVSGQVKHGILSKMYLSPENDRLSIETRCKICGKVIPIFDSSCDGYEQCGNRKTAQAETRHIVCRKCQNDSFSVNIKYEYSDINELNNLAIPETDNAFTWIWVTLKCNTCRSEYKHFIDHETA